MTHVSPIDPNDVDYTRLFKITSIVDGTINATYLTTEGFSVRRAFELKDVMVFKIQSRTQIKRDYPEHFDPNFHECNDSTNPS